MAYGRCGTHSRPGLQPGPPDVLLRYRRRLGIVPFVWDAFRAAPRQAWRRSRRRPACTRSSSPSRPTDQQEKPDTVGGHPRGRRPLTPALPLSVVDFLNSVRFLRSRSAVLHAGHHYVNWLTPCRAVGPPAAQQNRDAMKRTQLSRRLVAGLLAVGLSAAGISITPASAASGPAPTHTA